MKATTMDEGDWLRIRTPEELDDWIANERVRIAAKLRADFERFANETSCGDVRAVSESAVFNAMTLADEIIARDTAPIRARLAEAES